MLEMKNHKICKKVLGQYSRRGLSKEILHHDRYLSTNDFRKKGGGPVPMIYPGGGAVLFKVDRLE